MKSIVSVALLAALVGCDMGGDFGSDKHYTSAVITNVGTCGGGIGFFGGNRTCMVEVKLKTGTVTYWSVYENAVVGMKVYKECWREDGTPYCFSTATANPRRMYFKGGER